MGNPEEIKWLKKLTKQKSLIRRKTKTSLGWMIFNRIQANKLSWLRLKKNNEVKGRLGIVSLRNLRTAWQDSFGEEESVRDQAFAEFDNAFRNMWHRNQRNEFNDQDTAELELCHQLWEAEYDRQEQAVDENRNEKGTKSCCQTN